MAIFNTNRLTGVLVRGGIAEQEPASAFVEELEQQASEALSTYAAADQLRLTEARLLRAMAELQAEMTKLMLQGIGIIAALIALGVGIILGFG